MNHDHLRVLLEVARQGSFSAVAKRRNMDPSSISRIVQGVEHELGVRLFQRSTRHVALTEAGEAYLSRVSHLLEALDSAGETAKELGAHPGGTLRVTASVAFGQACLLPLLPEFMERYPDIHLELLLADANVDMVAERVDLALRLSPRMGQNFVRVKWFDSAYRICASPTYLERHDAITVPDDLRQHRCVLFGLPHPQSDWLVRDRSGNVRHLTVTPRACVSNGLAQRELALAGLGPALMPTWLIATDVATGTLVDLLPDYAATPSDFEGDAWLLYPDRTFLAAKTRTLVDFLLSKARREWSAAAIQRTQSANMNLVVPVTQLR
jgi:DNA-binding transcriptional LysR family regulator